MVREVALASGLYEQIRFLDDSYGEGSFNANVIGLLYDYHRYKKDFSHGFVAIGHPIIRKEYIEKLKQEGYNIPVLIHPEAYCSESASIDEGTVVMPKAVVQANCSIGTGCIISSGAVIDHNAQVGDFCHINSGAIVPAMERVENMTKVDYGVIYHRN